jgi:hypothetical protein
VPDVFINYRTGDEEGIASLIDHELVRAIGRDRVFFASQSIRAADDFTRRMLPAVQLSRVLLAVIGPGWLTDRNGRRRLDEPDDWTRREILTAFDCGVPVIPVIVGRTTSRLDQEKLPEPLRRLADLQSVRFDHRHRDADLAELFRALRHFVPAMDEAPEPAATDAGSLHNTAEDVGGDVFQARDNAHQQSGGVVVNGNAGTVISGSQAPIHTGRGNQYNGDSSFPRKGL